MNDILIYPEGGIHSILSKKFRFSSKDLQKPLINHIQDYFQNIAGGENLILTVMEDEYLDRHYLTDYSGFYSLCYGDYMRKCCRLHFFSFEKKGNSPEKIIENFQRIFKIDCEELKKEISLSVESISMSPRDPVKSKAIQFQENYLGFIVIRPLPKAPIGRVCLKPFVKTDPAEESFLIRRLCLANLWGVPLKVETIPFQEQDQGTAACATTAIWFALQGLAMLYQNSLPTPIEITKSACERLPAFDRTFPNTGLIITQMIEAIRKEKLDTDLYEEHGGDLLKFWLYAYLKAKIPVLMCLDPYMSPIDETKRKEPHGENDRHVITITGFKLKKEQTEDDKRKLKRDEIRLVSDQITSLIAHDDQIGFYIDLVLKKKNIKTSEYSVTTKCRNSKGEILVTGDTDVLIAPLLPWIRISGIDIYRLVVGFDKSLKELLKSTEYKEFTWEIYLTHISDFKRDVMCEPGMPLNYREYVLKLPMDRYLWRASAFFKGRRVMDLLYNATDCANGKDIYTQVYWDLGFGKVCNKIRASKMLEIPSLE